MLNSDSYADEVLYRDLVESMSEALIFADMQGVIRIWNPGAESIFGYTAAEAIGQNLDLIIPEQLRKAHWEGFQRAMNHGGTIHGRRSAMTRSLRKNGQPLYVDMSFAVVRNPAGETSGAVAIARDATERYLEEKNLRRQLAGLTAKTPQ
jgi:PAS domain S-box-containing protein